MYRHTSSAGSADCETRGRLCAVSREALLVLGMHRSGTSATAGLLVRLGAQGPSMLMPADASNPEGYWESRRLWEVHERLLREIGSRWDAYTHLDTEKLQSSISADLKDECRRALLAEFGDASRLVLKDPRMCRFVPFWLRVLESEAVTPAAVLVLRRPAEVARSLGVRNGFETDLSLLIWLRHVLDAEFHTRAVRRTFVRYRDLVDDWRSVAERVSRDLEMPWRSRTAADEAEIDRFVNSGLHHYRDERESPDVTPVLAEWLRRASAALQRLHDYDTSDAAAFADLDAVRVEFDRTTLALGDVGERIRRNLEDQVEHVVKEQRSLREQVAGLEAIRADLHERMSALEQALSAARQDAKALRESGSWRITAPLRAAYRLFR